MSDYQPQSGETVLLTVRAQYVGDGDFAIGGFVTNRVGRHFMSVEPLPFALPTAFGSRIEATRLVGVDSGTRTELVLAGNRWLAANDDHWYEADELADVEVLHDPDATESAAEAAAPEPVELPTGLGAVVRIKTLSNELAVAVRTADRLEPWRVRDVDGSSYWVALDEMVDVTVLSRGIEVDLP